MSEVLFEVTVTEASAWLFVITLTTLEIGVYIAEYFTGVSFPLRPKGVHGNKSPIPIVVSYDIKLSKNEIIILPAVTLTLFYLLAF